MGPSIFILHNLDCFGQTVYDKEHHRSEEHLRDRVEYIADAFKEERDRLFKEIKEQVNFEQDSSMKWGKRVLEPRLTAFFADSIGFEYKYSGMTKKAKVEMPKVLKEIQSKLETLLGVHYDFVLVNLYVDGKHKVMWHSDSESTMDIGDIASISLGPAERIFRMKVKDQVPQNIVFSERLKSGSVLRMMGDCQSALQHEVPEDKSCTERINLTFRRSSELAKRSAREAIRIVKRAKCEQ